MAMNPFSLGQSSGQRFTTRGRAGRRGALYAKDAIEDFEGAIDDMAALSGRFLLVGSDAARRLAERLAENTKQAIRQHMPPAGWRPRDKIVNEPFAFSKGRLAAAFGIYTPEDMRGRVDENDMVPIQIKHEDWALENGVAGDNREGRDTGEEVAVDMGAVTEIKRVRANIWSAEVGTFLPYAGLANDGGTMLIQPYGNPRARPVLAEWEGVHFMEEGIARTEAEISEIVEGSINEAIRTDQAARKTRRARQ